MNTKELTENLAQRLGIYQKDARTIVNTVFDIIAETVSGQEKVQITNFGTFSTRRVASKRYQSHFGRSENVTEEQITPTFSASKSLKDRVASNG